MNFKKEQKKQNKRGIQKEDLHWNLMIASRQVQPGRFG